MKNLIKDFTNSLFTNYGDRTSEIFEVGIDALKTNHYLNLSSIGLKFADIFFSYNDKYKEKYNLSIRIK